jgi:hypothetical protein
VNSTAPKPFVFVLMPFDPDFNDVYLLGIKPVCERAGAYAERVDDQIFTESILDRIYNQISKADLIISDMTGRNPNVFYETGYAHALGKKVILLTRNIEDIPFDLKHYPHIVYHGRTTDLIGELEKRVMWALEEPSPMISRNSLRLYADGYLLPNADELFVKYEIEWETCEFTLKIDVYNSTEKQIETAKFKIGILVDDNSGVYVNPFHRDDGDSIKHPGSKELFVFKKKSLLYPGSWKSFIFFLHKKSPYQERMPLSAVIRVFAESGVADFPFTAILTRKEKYEPF